jgi:hypothetical protein
MIGILALVAGWVGSQASDTACADAEADAAQELAHQFAPLLEFGPGERYFPTIPFFTAFRGRGLWGPSTAAPGGAAGRVSWDSLDLAYRDEVFRQPGAADSVSPVKPRRAAVFYRVRCLEGDDNRRLWLFLKNDPQAWRRLGLDALYRAGLRDAQFTAVEYFLYYVRDVGLDGHAHDTERILVFIPRDPLPARRDDMSPAQTQQVFHLRDSLRVIVGTGHSPTTPNNVLVLVGADAAALWFPHALVELGGHSSAPDRDADAEFHPGADINWNLTGPIWGTRDVQAVSGLGYFGAYKEWMTLPRRPGTAVVAEPHFADDQPLEQQEHRRKMAEVKEQRQEQLGRRLAPEHPGNRADYALLPVAPFERLAALARVRDSAGSPPDSIVRQAIRLVREEIAPRLRHDWEFEPWPDDPTVVARALGAIRLWSRPLHSSVKQGHTSIWRHPEFHASPVATLKAHLFRPTLGAIETPLDAARLLVGGIGTDLGRGVRNLQVGMVVPVFLNLAAIPGVLEIAVGANQREGAGGLEHRNKGSVSLVYDRHYKQTASYFFGIDWMDDRRLVYDDPRAGNVAFVAGISLMPLFPKPDLAGGVSSFLSTRLRIRLGLQVWKQDWQPHLGRLELRTLLYAR